jgi:hypothetical protein
MKRIGKSPTVRSLEALRDQGYKAWIVEKWNQFARVRQDMGGFADIVGVHPKISGALAINSCSISDIDRHIKKYNRNEDLTVWLKAGNFFEIHGWYPWSNDERRDEVSIIDARWNRDTEAIDWIESDDVPEIEELKDDKEDNTV